MMIFFGVCVVLFLSAMALCFWLQARISSVVYGRRSVTAWIGYGMAIGLALCAAGWLAWLVL